MLQLTLPDNLAGIRKCSQSYLVRHHKFPSNHHRGIGHLVSYIPSIYRFHQRCLRTGYLSVPGIARYNSHRHSTLRNSSYIHSNHPRYSCWRNMFPRT
jgi:hypothetical protein